MLKGEGLWFAFRWSLTYLDALATMSQLVKRHQAAPEGVLWRWPEVESYFKTCLQWAPSGTIFPWGSSIVVDERERNGLHSHGVWQTFDFAQGRWVHDLFVSTT